MILGKLKTEKFLFHIWTVSERIQLYTISRSKYFLIANPDLEFISFPQAQGFSIFSNLSKFIWAKFIYAYPIISFGIRKDCKFHANLEWNEAVCKQLMMERLWQRGSTYNDVKLGVDVDDPPVLVTHGQGRDVVIHKHVEGLDYGCLRGSLSKQITSLTDLLRCTTSQTKN